VHTRVYTDPQAFAAEMANIFEKTWVYVAHESEIAQPGDCKTAAVGRMPVIGSRGEDR
jgi:phenylpropionate dioxygenase-like ring-hydroxylating dioxygenase large terminal subunit